MLPITNVNVSHHEALFHLFFPLDNTKGTIEFENKYRKWTIVTSGSMFSREEMLLYIILYDNYLKTSTSDGVAHINYYDIHRAYRKKTSTLFRVDKDTKQKQCKGILKKYAEALKGLMSRTIRIVSIPKVDYLKNEYTNEQPLLQLNNYNTKGFDYSLGDFGKLLSNSGRTSTLLPTSLLSLDLRQLNMLVYGFYISRYIFINRRKAHSKQLRLGTLSIMKAIPYYSNGCYTNRNLYEEIMNLDVTRRYRLLKQFSTDLKRLLQMFVNENKILDFNMPSYRLKYFTDPESMITLYLV